MAAIPADLPSRVEETFAACPQFRIVVIGNTGVGKSSLVSSVFNISLSSGQIDVSHAGAGKADITRPYSSEENPRFVLHDSMGFEHGGTENWKIVEKFLRDRTSSPDLKERVHAIWLCIEAPRTGSRVVQTGDENLLSLAKELHIPVIAVFTKYDILVKERFRKLPKDITGDSKKPEARRLALIDYDDRIRAFKSSAQVPCVKVSTAKDYLKETLLELTDITRKALPDIEERLWLPWAAAQQVSGSQKVDLSISEGFKKYWINLGAGAFFQGHLLQHCIARIHEDILKVWNFNDPHALLSSGDFKSKIIHFVQPLKEELKVSGGGNSLSLINILFKKCRKMPLTARYLGAYIVELILVLHRLFTEIMIKVPPPRTLTQDKITNALEGREPTVSEMIHKRLKDAAPDSHPPTGVEQKVADLIRELLKPD